MTVRINFSTSPSMISSSIFLLSSIDPVFLPTITRYSVRIRVTFRLRFRVRFRVSLGSARSLCQCIIFRKTDVRRLLNCPGHQWFSCPVLLGNKNRLGSCLGETAVREGRFSKLFVICSPVVPKPFATWICVLQTTRLLSSMYVGLQNVGLDTRHLIVRFDVDFEILVVRLGCVVSFFSVQSAPWCAPPLQPRDELW